MEWPGAYHLIGPSDDEASAAPPAVEVWHQTVASREIIENKEYFIPTFMLLN